ncbi:putative glucuronosyltransferase GUT1 [Hordeum vulgare]|nr:putative glucuronosyltransferase GUT1 [Hordeum vulgare]
MTFTMVPAEPESPVQFVFGLLPGLLLLQLILSRPCSDDDIEPLVLNMFPWRLAGLVREKLWDLMVNEPDVIMEEGFPNATGREQSIKGMRISEYCLHPAGDIPSSCRLFDVVASLCIPVIVSDDIELPFEGMIDYTEFSIFVTIGNAVRPKWLTNYLRNIFKQQKDDFRRNLPRVQHIFKYDNSQHDSWDSAPEDGDVNHIWKKIHHKLPMIQEAVTREKQKPEGASIPLRCHCT